LRPVLHLLIFLSTLAPLFAATAPVRKPRPNVILITIDTLRADHVGCYGAKDVQTLTLDGLAHDGVVFERAISQVPLTWPSHAAILTGTYPFQNGVQDFTGQPLAPQFRSVAQAFKQQGYATAAVVSAFVLDRSWGLARGFDSYDDAFSAETFQTKDIGLVDRKAEGSVTHALRWLAKRPPKPFFLWLHLYDPHSPYDPPEPYRTQYKEHLYDGEIAYADHELGRLVGWLKRNQLYDRTLIVALSDHGESLGEHGEQEHGFFVYNGTVRIPLIVKPAAGTHVAVGRVTRPVETTMVAPTLLRLAGVKDTIEKQFASPSLFGKEESDSAAYSETFYPFSSFGWNPLHALETSRYHYIDAPTPELYDIVADPAETNNLAAQQKATVAVLKDKLQNVLSRNPFRGSEAGTSSMSPDALAKLRALGYVAYRSPVSAEALAAGLPDPKDKLWELNSILKAGDAFRALDFEAGKQLLDKVREKDPQMYIVPFMLGEAALQQQNWDEAVAQFQRCLQLNPNFDQSMTGLAHALVKLDKSSEAGQWINRGLQQNPQNYLAWYELGSIQRKSDPAAAASSFAKALAIQPNFAPLQRDLGMLKYEQKNYAEAARHLEKAIDLGVNDTSTYNFLGICYSLTGRLQKAVKSYRQALEIDPKLAKAHLNLADAYRRLGQRSASEKEFQTACKLHNEFCRFVPKAE